VHVPQIDGTDPNDLTAAKCVQTRGDLRAGSAARFMPGCENAKLRNFGMTLGIRDTRKIDALYISPAPMCASKAVSTTRSASFPSSSTATAS